MTDTWFRPRRYGYGAAPANWKGWAAMVAFLISVLAVSLPLVIGPSQTGAGPAFWQVTVWALALAAQISGFVRLARAKTAGAWSWRWGK
ncbi:MAG: hypothetical protein F9K29_03970 [Hyphomicrobiaceae bacterium]|nr:MAG: hypothetical protein F9K29_03970 [Hyphomicrobiaceae bacterium]